MKEVIAKVQSLPDDVRNRLVGENKIAVKAMPSSVATVINWAANSVGTPLRIIGQVVHAWCGTHYESTRMYDVTEATLNVLGCPISLSVDPDFIRQVEKSLNACVDRYGTNIIENPRGLNFQDGMLFITREDVRFEPTHSPDVVFTYCLPFKYHGERQESQVWSKFIHQIIPDDEMRRYTLTSFINAIAGDPMNAQRMLLLMGVGASGKSTLIDAVVNAIGKKNACRVDDLRNLTKDESRYRIDLANHILCICGDASGNLGNKDVLKQIVSKEEISGRRLYKEVEYFVPRASLLVASNEIGFTHALGDSGISRRIDIIQFKNPVSEEDRDPFIGEKLAYDNEQREMVMDMIDCLIDMQQKHGKMVRPEKLSKVLDDMRFDGDSFLSFLGASGLEIASSEDSGKEVKQEWIHQASLFSAYNYYCGMNGNQTGSMRSLKGKCETHGVIRESAGKRQHRMLFDVMDEKAYRNAFYVITAMKNE
jgi:phage/plasmid-associated DNA primase